MTDDKKATLFDRLAVGLLSALLATITSVFLWSLFALFSTGDILPMELLFLFIVAMFLLGFFTLDNYFIDILVPVWHFIIKILR